ncbi:protein of unknown function [Marinomonas polaris DSM 16579]|uniref:DUF4145 domain-containing protein n=1 Tax=Marinomonas polaris DSM 16579 TaxID=1122206 RepID=A0A1M5I3Q2_9GAMM|nr:DUF4145 domain-containing protein [Marinomonas polaris]SHG22945.1 protein of unknown function [Marinomonas polaris DSM 16579]
MKKNDYFPPIFKEDAFHCPHCNVYANQYYSHICATRAHGIYSPLIKLKTFEETFDAEWTVSKCQKCCEYIIWYKDNIIHPKKNFISPPNSDLDEDIQADYLEAANILSESPRSSAALLRLALQKLCKQLGEKGDNINDDIKSMVSKGLNPHVQKALDALRITGNNAVHPGEINLQEEPGRVIKLFQLINFIANKMITEPNEIESIYSELPESAKGAVDKRDGRS